MSQSFSSAVKGREDKETQCDFPPNYAEIKWLFEEKLRKANEKNYRELGMVHEETCVKCKVYPILGAKYVCSICEDFILCEKCEKERHEHPMYKYRISTSQKKAQKFKDFGFESEVFQEVVKKNNFDKNAAITELLFT